MNHKRTSTYPKTCGLSGTRGMYRPGNHPDHTDFFDEWDNIRDITFGGRHGKRYILNRIPLKLINFILPGPGMGHITKTDVGRRLIIDVTNRETTSYIE